MAEWLRSPRYTGKVAVTENGITFYFRAQIPNPAEYEKKPSKFGNFILLRNPKDKLLIIGVEFVPKLYQNAELMQECGVRDLSEADLLTMVRLAETSLRHKQPTAAENTKKERKYIQSIRHKMNDWRFPPLADLLQPEAA